MRIGKGLTRPAHRKSPQGPVNQGRNNQRWTSGGESTVTAQSDSRSPRWSSTTRGFAKSLHGAPLHLADTDPNLHRGTMLRFAKDRSGGWRYHLRAYRGRARWAPFCHELAAFMRPWLQRQIRAQRRVLLVGPSGGYTLPWEELLTHPDLCAVEPDPLARALLRRKAPGLRIDPRPALGWSPHGYCPKELQAWFQTHRGCALLFCNLLGQLKANKTLEDPQWRTVFLRELSRCDWLSYHDLVSGPQAADMQVLRTLAPSHSTLAPQHSIEFWQDVYHRASTPLHLVDHKTAALFADPQLKIEQRAFFLWPLCPGYWHVIEGLVSATQGRGCATGTGSHGDPSSSD